MNFRRRSKYAKPDEPEINLIPFIDVLLVILIFLMLSTTYSKFTELQIKLPVADTDTQRDYPKELIVAVGADGRFAVNKVVVEGRSVDVLAMALAEGSKSTSKGVKDTVVVISADASAAHQNVITVMEAARRVGLQQITFATQRTGDGR